MSNIQKLKFIECKPFITFIESILKERFYSVSESKVVKVLEIGCGPGDFALVLKSTLGAKVDITAIDPSNDIEEAFSKSNGSDVKFSRGDIFQSKFDTKFDLVLFTKSLHHCNPVDKAIENAFNLLENNGVLIAEEFNPGLMTTEDKVWCLDRFDLLRATGSLISAEERLKTAGYGKTMLSTFLDTSLPVSQRFNVGGGHHHNHNHGHEHGHHHESQNKHSHQHECQNKHSHGHEHQHECQNKHNHGNEHQHECQNKHDHGHEHQRECQNKHNHGHEHHHEHHHEHQNKHECQKDQESHKHGLSENYDQEIAPYNEIINLIETKFLKENVSTFPVPFFYHLVSYAGLKDNEVGQGALAEYYNQEERAIKEKILHPLGLNILAYKN